MGGTQAAAGQAASGGPRLDHVTRRTCISDANDGGDETTKAQMSRHPRMTLMAASVTGSGSG